MRFGGRLNVHSHGTRWAVARAHVFGSEDKALRASGSFAASMVDAWCDDVSIWSDMFELYQELAGSLFRPPTSADIDDWIKPRLRRAFEDGTLIAVEASLFGEPKKQAEKGVHGQATKVEPPLPPPAPRRPVTPPKTLHSFAIRLVDEVGTAVSGVDLLFSHGGSKDDGTTDGNGVARVEDSAATSAKAKIVDTKALRKALKAKWDQPRSDRKWLDESQGVTVVRLIGDNLPSFDLVADKLRIVSIQPYAARVRLVGGFFDTNKCFLLPSAMHGIRELKNQYDTHPGANLLLVGHTDTSGQEDYNSKLSLERAQAVADYLTDQVAAWEAFFGDSHPQAKRWSLLEVQYMLTALPEGGSPFYGGPPNGADDAWSRGAIRAFQRDQSLKEDGIAGPETRKALIKAYMALDGTTLPAGTKLTAHGGGEFFPVDETGDAARSAENRRVEIFIFDGPISPPPPGPTSKRGSVEYPRWLQQVQETIDIVLGPASTVAALRSRYALERFEAFAAQLRKDEFVGWASFIYGSDLPLDAFGKLRDDLLGKALVPPDIQLVPGGIDGKDSAYDNATQMIGVSEDLALAAPTDPAASGELIVLLMHEFGHHIDHVLRHQYSHVGGDAPGEEATHFTYAVTGMHHLDTDHVPFATLTRDGTEVELALDFPDFHAAVKKYASDPKAREDAKRGTVEFFGAGRGNKNFPKSSFGHRSIEDGLANSGPKLFDDENVRNRIYFGNWLRDFSQFNDPGWLRFLRNGFVNAVKPAKELMTELLDLAAHHDFEATVKPSDHVIGDFHVTTAKLGVYRPEEHIDNPQGMLDGSAVDPLFHGPVLPAEIAIDPTTGLKAYIATRGGGFQTAADFIDRSLRGAVAAGKRAEGYRLFGQALHTLEDLFAHSNFVELSLIRLGHTAVYPWVGPAARLTVVRGGKPVPRIPMVTGVFGMVDTGVSGASAIGEALQHPIECKAGEFSPASVAILKLLESVTPDRGKAIESLFSQIGKLEETYPAYATFLCRCTDAAREWLRNKLGTAIREEIKQLGQAERAFFDDPTSTAPTHSQLAKDHDDHPLHVTAAICARIMVADVGRAMFDAWEGKRSAAELVQYALRYVVHPDDIDVSVVAGPGAIVAEIKDFADKNPAVVNSLDFPTSKARFLAEALAARERQLDEASVMFARNEENADRTAELTRIV